MIDALADAKVALSYPFELLTERLALRSPAVEHADQLRAAIEESLEALQPWMPWATHVPEADEARQNCGNAAQAFQDGKDYRIHLFRRDTGEFVGGTGLHNPDWSVPKFEIGYWVRQSLQGHGYITEAVVALTDFALQRLRANRVEISCSSKNVRSRNVAERAGFRLDATLQNHGRHADGTLRDTLVFSRISSEDTLQRG